MTANASEKSAAIDALKAAMKDSKFLKAGLNSVPYIGLAVSAFDAFFGGGKEESGPQPVALQPMTIEMSTLTTGTITAPALYSNPTFNNPGTRAITTALDYPYYNEAMGVFSLLTCPTIEYRNITYTDANGNRARRYEFKVPQQLQYLINPASGLEVQEFQVALLQNAGIDYPDILPNGWSYGGPAAVAGGTSIHVFRTDYVDSGCLPNNLFRLETHDARYQTAGTEVVIAPNSSNTFLKFMLNLRVINGSANTQNTLLVLKYPVTMRLVSQFTSTAGQPCVPVQPQASASDVQALCTGSIYQTAVALRPTKQASAPAGEPAAAVAGVQVYPNPTAGAATIRFTGTAAGRASAYVTNMLGQHVLSIMQHEIVAEGEQQRTFATAALAPGLYQCVVETPDGKRVSTRLSVVR